MDDVDETGWGAPEHLWVLRHIRVDVLAPLVEDDRIELRTWCSGTALVAAGRRLSITGDRGGRVELDSVWVHLAPDARPARIGDFGAYAVAAAGRIVSPRVELPHPPANGPRIGWPLRATDIDLLGHVNNAVYWQAVEHCLLRGGPDPRAPMRAVLGYRHAIDLGEEIELVQFSEDGRYSIAFMAHEVVKAVACIGGLGGPSS
jgi:acyl-ACP thioesterase